MRSEAQTQQTRQTHVQDVAVDHVETEGRVVGMGQKEDWSTFPPPSFFSLLLPAPSTPVQLEAIYEQQGQ